MIWLRQKNQKYFKICGYAGTGKTFLISAIIIELQKPTMGKHYSYCAPTGKAAFRISQVLQNNCQEFLKDFKFDRPASFKTIHSEIYQYDVNKGIDSRKSFNLKPFEQLPKYMIIDEASMVTPKIQQDIDRFVSKCLFVGDIGQLPCIQDNQQIQFQKQDEFSVLNDSPVEGGSFLLTEITRQAEQSPILLLSQILRVENFTSSKNSLFDVYQQIKREICKIHNKQVDKSITLLADFDKLIGCLKKEFIILFNQYQECPTLQNFLNLNEYFKEKVFIVATNAALGKINDGMREKSRKIEDPPKQKKGSSVNCQVASSSSPPSNKQDDFLLKPDNNGDDDYDYDAQNDYHQSQNISKIPKIPKIPENNEYLLVQGEPIIILQNNFELSLFNGQRGTVKDFQLTEQESCQNRSEKHLQKSSLIDMVFDNCQNQNQNQNKNPNKNKNKNKNSNPKSRKSKTTNLATYQFSVLWDQNIQDLQAFVEKFNSQQIYDDNDGDKEEEEKIQKQTILIQNPQTANQKQPIYFQNSHQAQTIPKITNHFTQEDQLQDDSQYQSSSKKLKIEQKSTQSVLQQTTSPLNRLQQRVQMKKEENLQKYKKEQGLKNKLNFEIEKHQQYSSQFYNGAYYQTNFEGRSSQKTDQIVQTQLAYAVTCHKMQGSESDIIYLDLENGYYMHSIQPQDSEETKQKVIKDFIKWTYTAVTRAKKQLTIKFNPF